MTGRSSRRHGGNNSHSVPQVSTNRQAAAGCLRLEPGDGFAANQRDRVLPGPYVSPEIRYRASEVTRVQSLLGKLPAIAAMTIPTMGATEIDALDERPEHHIGRGQTGQGSVSAPHPARAFFGRKIGPDVPKLCARRPRTLRWGGASGGGPHGRAQPTPSTKLAIISVCAEPRAAPAISNGTQLCHPTSPSTDSASWAAISP